MSLNVYISLIPLKRVCHLWQAAVIFDRMTKIEKTKDLRIEVREIFDRPNFISPEVGYRVLKLNI